MLQSKVIALALVAVVGVCSVQAQSEATNATCQTVEGLKNVNATLLQGKWFEEVRAPARNISCARATVELNNNSTELSVITNFAASQSGLLMDKFYRYSFDVSQVIENTGFNPHQSNSTFNAKYKILKSDYESYAILCGYTNENDTSSSFGVILSRVQVLNTTQLEQLQNDASKILPLFNDTSARFIHQSEKCHNSAATSVPSLAALLAAFFALHKILKY